MQVQRRLPPLSLPFALLGLLLSHTTMLLMQTAELDPGAHWIGLGVSTVVGLVTGWVVSLLPRSRRARILPYLTVLAASALTGMIMQLVLLLREPFGRSYMLSSGFGTSTPTVWTGVGAALGLVPGLVLIGAYLLVRLLTVTAPAQDAWERTMAPFSAAIGLGGAFAFALGGGELRYAAAAIVLVALAASIEILLRDRWRAAWLKRILSGDDPLHEVVPLESAQADVPLAVGNVEPRALVVRVVDGAGYRSAARDPVVRTTHSLALAIAPLVARRRALVFAQLGTVLMLLFAAKR